MAKILGIDLGTTNSAMSIIEGGEVKIISNSEGNRTTPSIIAFTENGERKVGEPAKRQAITNPEKTIYSIKRFMGLNYDDCLDEIKRAPYKVNKSDSGLPIVDIENKTYTPQEISAMILTKLKKDAESYIGEKITEAVITVPAYFSESQRKDTIAAGKIAGLEVRRIINEPTAAALTYGIDRSEDEQKIIVFDFGGGTHDVTVLEFGDGVFEVLSTSGDVHLGGDDVDNVLIDYMVEKFKEQENIDLTTDPMAIQRLKDSAEKAKIELSSTSTTEINLPYITATNSGPKHFNIKINRSEFERLIQPIVERTITPCKEALEAAKLNIGDIDQVILVGGSTRIPAIQKAVEDFFVGCTINKSVDPDLCVAMGAGTQGAILSSDIDDVILLDVTPLNIGIETMGGVATTLVEANTTIPTKKSQIFSTAADNQSSVSIKVCSGNRPLFNDNQKLGEFILEGIEPAPRGIPQIEVTFDIDANSILTVTAIDKNTGEKQSIRIEGSGQLSPEDIERMKTEAEKFEAEDRKRVEIVEEKNKCESIIFETQKKIEKHQDRIADDTKTQLNDCIASVTEAMTTDDVTKMKELTNKIIELSSVFIELEKEEINNS